MTNFDYKKYSLENLENWLHDAMGGDATPDEIYDLFVKVVLENYEHHKQYADKAYELLSKLNNNSGQSYEDVLKEKEYYEPSMPPWGHSDLEYGIHHKDKVKKWILPVDKIGECYFVTFPDDLLAASDLYEGDTVEWVDNNDGSYTLKKIVRPLGMEEC